VEWRWRVVAWRVVEWRVVAWRVVAWRIVEWSIAEWRIVEMHYCQAMPNADLPNADLPNTQMPNSDTADFDPNLDLLLDRTVAVPVSHLWQGWTDPVMLMKWFCPLPYLTIECDMDLRPGGGFRTVMKSPEGQTFDNIGCYLDVVPGTRLVWTSSLGPGFRPKVLEVATADGPPSFHFTCVLTFTSTPEGARYQARGMHATAEDRIAHEAMGFADGWGAALDQLVALWNG
jgi:uncharacterized protein YndB with AHSA1/START domain